MLARRRCAAAAFGAQSDAIKTRRNFLREPLDTQGAKAIALHLSFRHSASVATIADGKHGNKA